MDRRHLSFATGCRLGCWALALAAAAGAALAAGNEANSRASEHQYADGDVVFTGHS